MRKVAASMARGGGVQLSSSDVLFGGGGGNGSNASDCFSTHSSVHNNFSTSSSAVGNTLLMGADGSGSGVSCITFDQHSMLVRYPNSMSNLRRLRCYLLACQVSEPAVSWLCNV